MNRTRTRPDKQPPPAYAPLPPREVADVAVIVAMPSPTRLTRWTSEKGDLEDERRSDYAVGITRVGYRED